MTVLKTFILVGLLFKISPTGSPSARSVWNTEHTCLHPFAAKAVHHMGQAPTGVMLNKSVVRCRCRIFPLRLSCPLSAKAGNA